jgi:hypothetical protein
MFSGGLHDLFIMKALALFHRKPGHLNLEFPMCPNTLIPRPATGDALFRVMTPLHDAWMADADRVLEPMMHWEATFWDRWTAVNYLREQFPERLRLEQELLTELHAFLTPELNERLRMQIERLARLHHDLEQLGQRRTPASEMARAVRELLEALRLWYAEIELAAGGIRRKDIGTQADQLLGRIEHAVLQPSFA